MKRLWISMVIMFVAGVDVFAQGGGSGSGTLPALSLSIANDKTTNLIFPYAIKSVDRGSKSVLVQKAKNVENVLQVKAIDRAFKESNLTVITADGTLYSFLLVYAENPPVLNLKLGKDDALLPMVKFSDYSDNERRINGIAEWVSTRKASIKGKGKGRFDMEIKLIGIFVDNDLLYFQFFLSNNSQLNYDVDQLRLFIRDKKQSKRTAFQETELNPLYVHGNDQVIRAYSKQNIVAAFPKFTIPDKKVLVVQLLEKNGGRNLEFQAKYNTLEKVLEVK
ncbi:conjugative transposon protein TraN [Olivibacter domesticus]